MPSPFFIREEKIKKSTMKKPNVTTIGLCEKCGLYKHCISPKMPYTGGGRKKILIIAEAPGKIEDEKNIQLIGRCGQELRTVLSDLGLDLDADFWKTNAVTCFVNPKVSVYTSDGYKRILNIKIGDYVLTHKGRFRKVLSRTHDYNFYTKEYYKVSYKLGSGRVISFNVTKGHRFLVNNKWLSIENLQVDDKIKFLGETCCVCGKVYSINFNKYDKEKHLKVCSSNCKNKIVKPDGRKISNSMIEQYKLGIRNRYKITNAANIKFRKLIKSGWRNTAFIFKECFLNGRIKCAKNRCKHNKLTKHKQLIGFGEVDVCQYLLKNKIEFYHQYNIYKYNYDFYLPKFNLLVEIDNPDRKNQKSFCKRKKEKDILAKETGFDLVRISSDNSVVQLKRILKNHRNEYLFTEVLIVNKELIKAKKKTKLYCLEVEEDNSFIAMGIVHHNCRPKNNSTPTTSQINYCRHNLLKTISELKPEKIITLGAVALQSLIGQKTNINSIGRWVGHKIPDQDYKCWIYPLHHPSYVFLRESNNIALGNNFINCFKQAIEHDEAFFTLQLKVEILKGKDDIISFLDSINENDIISFDYETSGLKPQAKGHFIQCISMYVESQNRLVVFHFLNDDKDFLISFKTVLEKNKLIGANIKYEHIWTFVKLGINIKNWYWDTMLAAHIIDNRTGITGLKFQIYTNFGIIGYDNDVKKYIETNSKSANVINQVDKCDQDKLMTYCALDSYYTYKLYKKQDKEMRRSLRKGMNLFMQGIISFADIQLNGIRFDKNAYIIKEKEIQKKMDEIECRIFNHSDIKDIENFNYNSTDQLRKLFFDKLKLKPIKKTQKGTNSVDRDVLEKINHPIAKAIIDYRYYTKIKNTYFDQLNREAVETDKGYYIHPGFNLNTVKTYRSSSSNPNLQNIPRKDKYTKELTRSLLLPSKGNRLLEIDFGQIEVRINACYTQDPELITYCYDPESDMHTDMTMRLFNLERDEVKKDLRNIIKNKFVFPLFYGDWWKSCAVAIFQDMKREHKRLTGVRELGIIKENRFGEEVKCTGFFKKVKDLENWFWYEKFCIAKEWKDNIWQEYLRNGYIRLKTGFICQGVMSRKDVTNYPIQGTAFHCLLKSIIDLGKDFEENNIKTKIVGQIHDSILFDLFPGEKEYVFRKAKYYMTEKIREDWDWIIVPLVIDAEITEIDQPWSTKKEIKI